jgi:integrase
LKGDIVTKPTVSKPAKPYADFPLFPHASKRWCKKIRTKNCYFGSWADGWQAALALYQEQRDDLHAGRKPRPKASGLTVLELVNRFLSDRGAKVNSGELSARTLGDCLRTCEGLLKAFGRSRLVDDLDPTDFAKLRATYAAKWGPQTLTNEIARVKTVLHWGYNSGLLHVPMRMGLGFKRPPKAVLRRARQVSGERMYDPATLRLLIEKADPVFRAMLMLAINCGMGNSDCSAIERRHLDLEAGMLDFPRPKTSVDRKAALWPETIEALKVAMAMRPAARDPKDEGAVFLTRSGQRFVRATRGTKDADGKVLVKGGNSRNYVWLALSKLLAAHSPDTKRSFYDLRHTFRTVADSCGDQVAVNLVMGHADGTMGGVYRERIDDSRLRVVADTVHSWLYEGASNE